jgi:hypothetical protein
MCVDQQWTEAIPLVLLGIRTSFKADLQPSVANLVYGKPLRILGKLLTPGASPVDLITEFRQYMARLRPIPAPPWLHSSSDLEKCTHVFLRQDTMRQALEPPSRSCHGETRRWKSSCAGGPSTCQPTGSSQPTSSTGSTAETTSTHQPQQLRP